MERRGGKEKSEKGGKEARGYKGKRDGMEGERMGRGGDGKEGTGRQIEREGEVGKEQEGSGQEWKREAGKARGGK